MGKFVKRPIEIEAVRLGWDTWSEMCEHAEVGRLEDGKPQGCWVDPATGKPLLDPPLQGDVPSVFTEHQIGLLIPTLEGLMLANEGDWVIRGIQGELYSCKPDIFEATYDPKEVGEALIEKIHADLGPPGPRLGMATTRELLEELECRMQLVFQPTWETTGFAKACSTALRVFPPEELNYKVVDYD